MKIEVITSFLDNLANPIYQESYDNAGLITGRHDMECTGILTTLDATEPVILEAIEKKCNLIVAHHPIVFSGLKKINGKNYVERAVIAAIKNDICIYAVHTNLDNIIEGVNGKIADLLALANRSVLLPKTAVLKKLFTFVPESHIDAVRNAMFMAGAGQIGNYTEASFNSEGVGTFKAGAGANPFVGEYGKRHYEKEIKLEVIFPAYREQAVVTAMRQQHPYEEPAFDIITLSNDHPGVGSGLIGDLPDPINENAFLSTIKKTFNVPVIRHTRLTGRPVQRVAVCGGAGSFLISKALALKADFYITSDVKYHEFFDANDRMVIADIGHFESEQFTIGLLHDALREKFPNFAVLKSGTGTNPVNYYH